MICTQGGSPNIERSSGDTPISAGNRVEWLLNCPYDFWVLCMMDSGAAQIYRPPASPHRASAAIPARFRSAPVRAVARCLLEARPAVQAMVLLRFAAASLVTVAGRRLPIGNLLLDRRLVTGAAAMMLVSIGVYLVNGVTDLVADIANGSSRPLAQGRLSVATARRMAWLTILGGLCCAAVAGPLLLGCAVAMAIAGLGYSCGRRPWKQRPRAASASIGVLGASTYLAGSIAAGYPAWPPAMLLAAAMTLWMSLVGALTKDFSDVAGDLLTGRQTMATGTAERRMRRRAALNALGLAGGFLLSCWAWAPRLMPAAECLLLVAAVVAVLSLHGSSRGSRAETRRPYRAFMVGQYAANAIAIACAISW